MPENRPTYDDILADPENRGCSCPQVNCRFKDKCAECVAVHRYYDSVPACLGRAFEKAINERT